MITVKMTGLKEMAADLKRMRERSQHGSFRGAQHLAAGDPVDVREPQHVHRQLDTRGAGQQ
jgi:hypothetical protein